VALTPADEFLLEAPGGPEYEHQPHIFLKNSNRSFPSRLPGVPNVRFPC
jgi:hypothetical protein